ncbi:hypothetical protein [Nocardiopsis sp. CNT312]|uniref:hypothetical protein n=1 Tax=Nocardiopsis sp. CNT312 TaxID=1137268 RepID=UPI001E3A4E83|nr:hypothetical protein [Nocardiopsis sp. CNT312]
MKKSAAVALLAAGMAAAATPAWADATATNSSAMLLDCAKGVSNGDAYASCFGSFSEEWRLRADCPFQPDRYSSWQSGDGNVTVSCTLGDARTAIIELR